MEEKNRLCFFDPRESKAKFYGLIDGEYCRVPASVREHMTERMASLSFNTSGGRIRFITDSTRLGIEMEVSDNLLQVPDRIALIGLPVKQGYARKSKTAG